ncbi:hypothetical protein KAR10_03930 [bacterium]|nr:hypothetical protein [bacterium]
MSTLTCHGRTKQLTLTNPDDTTGTHSAHKNARTSAEYTTSGYIRTTAAARDHIRSCLVLLISTLLLVACASSPDVHETHPRHNENTAGMSLSGLLTHSPGEHPVLSSEQVGKLLSLEKRLLLKHLQKAFDIAECSPTGKIPSQPAVILAGVYGGEEFRDGIEKTWQCDKKNSKALPPCEYYCSYKFALNYLDIKFRGKNPGPFQTEFYIANKIDKIAFYLEKLTESDLLASVENKHRRPDIPKAVLKAGAGSLTEQIIEMNYRLAIYYSLGMRGMTIQSRNFLLADLLKAYGRDTSGDAVVNFAEPVLYQLAYRLNTKP